MNFGLEKEEVTNDTLKNVSLISEKKRSQKRKRMLSLIRRRSLFLYGGAIVAGVVSFKSDPDNGMSITLAGLSLIQVIWAILGAHLARKALTDYEDADQEQLFAKAAEHPIGAGLGLIALALVFCGLLGVFAPRAHAEKLPAGFIKYGSMLKNEQRKYWHDHPDPSVLAGLVEQESCISLTSSGCWNPATGFKTTREEGAGMGQITRAYRQNGLLRFDSLNEIKNQYQSELSELSWGNVYTRPDLQFRAMVLMSKRSALYFRNASEWLVFGDAAYNGGVVDVQQERRACKMTIGCNPDLWFGHVEHHCLKSRHILYGGRSACDINREHAKNVFLIRKQKYTEMMNGL